MLTVLNVLLIIVVLGIAAGVWIFIRKAEQSIKNQLSGVTDRVNIHLEQTARLTQEASKGTLKTMADVYQKLAVLETSGQRIFEVGREIGKLQDVLRAPKARGGFGEFMLADLLSQMIPRDHVQLQYTFRSGARVDAVICIGGHLVPIDAKFPLENFQRLLSAEADEERRKIKKEFARDIRKHIDAISERYIVPDEGTFDFALMYIPAENVYYEVMASDDDSELSPIHSYAIEKRVIPVSPNTFYAYLQVILLGLRGLRIDQTAREIAESLRKMQSDFKKVGEDLAVLGTHLSHTYKTYERVQRAADQFQVKLNMVDEIQVEPSKKNVIEATSEKKS